ncbi:MAG: DUF3084 domain-containing protein [Candidatus Saganbacteria bacterium]|nr:DUF3084 domain-containing protein [Candidatus Saganbacteria bacterium]
MFVFGAKIIIILLLVGGAIAIIGNYIGRAIGRRRLTVFNLRPRHTANAITILSGIIIVFMTVGVMLTISQDARTALFGLEELRQDVQAKTRLLEQTKEQLELRISERERLDQELLKLRGSLEAVDNDLARAKANLKWAKREIDTLEKTKAKLTQEIKVSRQGNMLFKVNEILLTSVIKAGPDRAKLEAGLKQLLSASDVYVRSYGVQSDKHLIFISPEDFNSTVAELQRLNDERIVAVKVTRNTLFGEEVPVCFELIQNRLIYHAGETVAEEEIAAKLSVPEIEQEIKKLLDRTRSAARQAGVLADPGGSIGSVPYAQIFALAKKINEYSKGVELKTLAKHDTYTIGPLEVEFKIFYK